MSVEPHIVTPDDDGIRPAGKPDECFYCHQKVGEKHTPECVMVTEDRLYNVWFDGNHIGTWTRADPAHWDIDMCRFHKNESTWCANNMRHEGKLDLIEGNTLPFDPEDSTTCTLCHHVVLAPVPWVDDEEER